MERGLNAMLTIPSRPVAQTIDDATFAVVDVETTGIDPSRDRVVEVACALVRNGRITEAFSTLVNPGRPILAVASAVHGITDDMVVHAPQLTAVAPKLQGLCTGAVVVAHNASFDLEFLPFLKSRPHLCSMRLAQRVVPDAPNYKNQVLRYHLGVNVDELPSAVPHRALGDVYVTAAILRRCLDRYLAGGAPNDIDALVDNVAAPALLEALPFGKHRGRRLRDVPTDYLQWAISAQIDLSIDVTFSMKHELHQRQRKP
jgi:DNA polymerase III epsilon subunit family exonuclease